ncbi:hypothetical protein PLACP1_21550 [Planifilum fimeticola]
MQAFCTIFRDHHVTPDEHGRLLLHGLITATAPTKIGGDLHVLARKMVFNFLRPVFTKDMIRREKAVAHDERLKSKAKTACDLACFNRDGKKVLGGSFEGMTFRQRRSPDFFMPSGCGSFFP